VADLWIGTEKVQGAANLLKYRPGDPWPGLPDEIAFDSIQISFCRPGENEPLHFGAERSERLELGVDTIEYIISIDDFTALGRQPAFLDLFSDLVFAKSEYLVPLFQEPERLSDALARTVVAAGLHFALNELFEF
jgi:hypothetical protein